MQDLARQLLIFGTHVHIGIEDRDFLIDAANVARYFLPHILCLSTSSPFWIGRQTGPQVVPQRRIPRVSALRRHARPPTRWNDYQTYLDTLIATDCIPDGSKIWWDVRPHWKYPTLEFRVCDVFTRVDEAVCVAAILQAIVAKLWKMRRDNITFRVYPSELIDENKWRAVRYGLDGKLIDFGKAARAAGARADSRAHRVVHRLTSWTSWAAARTSSTRTRSSRKGRAPTGRSRCTRRRATSRPSSTT